MTLSVFLMNINIYRFDFFLSQLSPSVMQLAGVTNVNERKVKILAIFLSFQQLVRSCVKSEGLYERKTQYIDKLIDYEYASL